MAHLEITTTATQYEVNVLPEGDVNAHVWRLYVVYRGQGLWSVTDGHAWLRRDGTWSYSIGRGDALQTALADAIERAKDGLRTHVVNGMTAYDWITREQAREAAP